MSWQREAIAYQIYPKSFKDSNNDGIGDLQGIIEKLDYLEELGINLIWLNPVYESPNDDNGYDISDYKKIISEFGTIEDFKCLLKEAHKRSIKVIMDLVVNHTSDEHPWFIESRKSRNSEKRDWYIWRKGKEGHEPNNWESIFGGSAWEYDKETDEYYMHLFSKKMPDLNWENESLRKAVYEIINWWLDMGIDGFRVDAISHIKKEDLSDIDNPKGIKYVSSFDKNMNQPGLQDLLNEINENTFRKYDILTVAEASGVGSESVREWTGSETGKFDMIFHFEHINLWNTEEEKGIPILKFKEVFSKWQKAIEEDGWIALFLENHDLVRSVSKFGDDKNYWKESAKALALMYFMQKGTPFIYQGQELGMTNADYTSAKDFRDISSIFRYEERVKNGMAEEESLHLLKVTGRDNTRTPMQWNNTLNGGFSERMPWIKVNEDYKYINVEEEKNDEYSILNFYKEMIRIRKANKTLIYGKYNLLMKESNSVYAYIREDDENKFLIICNLTDKQQEIDIPYTLCGETILLKNYKTINKEFSKLLRPFEARMYHLI